MVFTRNFRIRMNSAHGAPSGRTLSISKKTQGSPIANSSFFTTTSQPITRARTIRSAPSIGARSSMVWIETSLRSMGAL
jgi:hypothetical protein